MLRDSDNKWDCTARRVTAGNKGGLMVGDNCLITHRFDSLQHSVANIPNSQALSWKVIEPNTDVSDHVNWLKNIWVIECFVFFLPPPRANCNNIKSSYNCLIWKPSSLNCGSKCSQLWSNNSQCHAHLNHFVSDSGGNCVRVKEQCALSKPKQLLSRMKPQTECEISC